METVLIQINNTKAYSLLKDLEELDIIKVLKKNIDQPQKLSEKYKGILTKEEGESLKEHIKQMRSEWENI